MAEQAGAAKVAEAGNSRRRHALPPSRAAAFT